MKKTLIISILTGMLVIGLIPGAMANPKIDSNAQAMNEKQIDVNIKGALANEVSVNQVLTNNGNLDNKNIGLGGNAEAISVNTGTQKTGNGNKLGGCNSGDWSGVGGKGKGTGTGAGTGGAGNSGSADGTGTGVGVGTGGDSNGDSGNGGNGCNSVAASDLNQDSSAAAVGGEGNSGDVMQMNSVTQTASADVDVDQTLLQPVDIREFQVANAHEDSTIDFTIPVFDNEDSQVIIEKENPTVENTDKNQN